jgi:hypothetical protein
MVANRALEPLSKLAASKWLCERAWIDGLDELDEDACYRAMDWLLEVEDELAEQVYFETADLLNLEVDLLFFDTTSSYFERETPDPPTVGEDGEQLAPAFRVYGHSKDHRPDLPQVVIGMAVTRTGIPIRVWCWPGNSSDQELIRQVKDDLRSWKLSRVVWVGDRGFQSAENRRYLQRAGGHYIFGEKLRGNDKEANTALARQGRYHLVAENLRVKEVIIDDGTMRDRFVICHNPEEARRDQAVREQLLAQLEQEIDGSDKLTAEERQRLHGRLSAKRGLKRFIRTTKNGLLRIDRAAVAAEGAPRRQVPAQNFRPDPDRRGHRARLQAAVGDRTRLARHEEHPRSAARAPPQRRPDPRARTALLARAAADPDRRNPHPRHLAQPPRRAPTPAPRDLRQARRHQPSTHRADQPPAADPPPARHRRASAVPPARRRPPGRIGRINPRPAPTPA